LHRDARNLGARLLLGDVVKRRTKVEPQVAMDEIEQVERRDARGRLQIAACLAGEVQDLMFGIDHHISGGVSFGDLARATADGPGK
jgi:hypothetical protein